jgi:asparagine synthase (glutamine-hydrolysing)
VCGIAGLWDTSGRSSGEELAAVAERMTATLEHRGPDDQGVWSDPEAGVSLGSCRLAVVDLTKEGHQPMASASGRFLVTFNGEIYNHAALRAELETIGQRFRGRSDTEVLLAAVEEWGLHGALERFNGMFAIALWDRRDRRLHLARDRLGEKPLYHAWLGRTLVFGSELKALRTHPAFVPEIDRDVLALFLRHKYVPAPRSIYRGVWKQPPGTVITLGPDGGPETTKPQAYWSLADVIERGLADRFPGTATEAAEELDGLLRDAVALRMIADVPLGAFLSGGTDSSTVVALMQAQSGQPVRTFTIGFTDPAWDESPDARRVAELLGTDHTDVVATPDEALAVIPRLPEVYDEPFADSSQIPTRLVSELARASVTVALSGDGGDEVFGGYNRYGWAPAMWRRFGWLPGPARRGLAGALTTLSPAGWDGVLRVAGPVLPRAASQRLAGEKLHKLARALRADGPDAMYGVLTSHWQDPAAVAIGASENGRSSRGGGSGFVRRMMFLDSVGYLPDDILTKLDRATMSVSLEGRVPYLDHRVVEFAWRLPMEMKVAGGTGKLILRRVLDRYVPMSLVQRPKMGFGVPIGEWLRGPLREWAQSLIEPTRLRRDGYLRPEPIRASWDDHQSGRRNRQYELWDVLMFQAWLDASRRPVEAAR